MANEEKPVYRQEKMEEICKKVGVFDRLGEALGDYCGSPYGTEKRDL